MGILQEGNKSGIDFNQIPIGSRKPLDYDTRQEVDTAGHIIFEQFRKGDITDKEFKKARNKLNKHRGGIEEQIQARRHLAIALLREGEISAEETRIRLDKLEHPEVKFNNITFSPNTGPAGNSQIKSIVAFKPEERKPGSGINFNLANVIKAVNLFGQSREVVGDKKSKPSKQSSKIKFGLYFGKKHKESLKDNQIISSSDTSISEDTQPMSLFTAQEEDVIRKITNPRPPIDILRENVQDYLRAQKAKERLLPQKPGDKFTTLGAGLFGKAAAIITPQGLGVYSGVGEPSHKEDGTPAVDNMVSWEDIAEGKITLYVAPGGRGPNLLKPLIRKVMGDIGTIIVNDHRIGQEYPLMSVTNPHDVKDDILNMAREEQYAQAIIKITNEHPELVEEIQRRNPDQS